MNATDTERFSNCNSAPQTAVFGVDDLRHSIANGYVVVEFQPKVPLDPTDPSHAVEVLTRIRHPQFGLVSPDQFIALAEGHGLIALLTDAIVRQAFSDWRKWFEHGLTLHLAINVSPELLDNNEWADRFLSRCAEYAISPEYIVLEITKSSSKAASETALDILTRLKLKGMTLSIDDFGTGFSSLATLYRLPFNELKIDKCFTMGLDRNPAARALIESTVEMAQRLGLRVTAEGVETAAHFEQLRLIGCHDAQGYFISKSLPASAIPGFFAGWRRAREAEAGTRPGLMPKIAAIQALLDEVLTPNSSEQTVILSSTQNLGADASGFDVVARIAPLVLQGRSLAALAACHRAARLLQVRAGHAALRAQVLELQRLLEYELVCHDDLVIAGTVTRYRLLPRRSALIGRPSADKSVDVAINCRWLSRGERNLFLYFDHENWFLEDLGSTNGSMVGGIALLPGKPIDLPPGATLVEIGRRTGRHAPLYVCLQRCPAGAVAITLVARDRIDAESWPTREQDLETTWVVFQGELAIGGGEGCAIRTAVPNSATLADIRFQNGLWIAPRPGVALTLDGVEFENPVPLIPDAKLQIGDIDLMVERAPASTAVAAAADDANAGAAQRRIGKSGR